MGNELTDEELMQRLQQNDLSAFEMLYQRHQGRVWGYFSKRAPRRTEDLFQECFARLLERRDQWKGTPFLPWLLLMARHLLIDDYRREKIRAGEELPDVLALPVSEVDEWLEGLPQETRDLVKQHYLAGWSYEELAKMHRTQEGTLRQKVSRALKSLRKEWG